MRCVPNTTHHISHTIVDAAISRMEVHSFSGDAAQHVHITCSQLSNCLCVCWSESVCEGERERAREDVCLYMWRACVQIYMHMYVCILIDLGRGREVVCVLSAESDFTPWHGFETQI